VLQKVQKYSIYGYSILGGPEGMLTWQPPGAQLPDLRFECECWFASSAAKFFCSLRRIVLPRSQCRTTSAGPEGAVVAHHEKAVDRHSSQFPGLLAARELVEPRIIAIAIRQD